MSDFEKKSSNTIKAREDNQLVFPSDPGTNVNGTIWAAGAAEKTYEVNSFDPAVEDSRLSYTPGRVARHLFNDYSKTEGFEVFGYMSDWGIYDSRYEPDQYGYKEGGRGTDIMRLMQGKNSYFDRIVLGFSAIIGDNGIKADTIKRAAVDFGIARNESDVVNHEGKATFTDYWGDVGAYINCGFPGWKEVKFNPAEAMGVLGALVQLNKKYPTMPIGLSLGGWSMSEAFHHIAKDADKRMRLAQSLKYIFDLFPMFKELDIDWEYPNYKGEERNKFGPEDVPNYVELIKEIRKVLPDIPVSIATIATPEGLKAGEIDKFVAAGVDKINLMTYDFFGSPWAEKLMHHTNLRNTSADDTRNSVEKAVDYLINDLHIQPKKINIGYAGYSRNAKNATIVNASPLVGNYDQKNNDQTGVLGSFEKATSEWPDLLYNYVDGDLNGINGFKMYTDKVSSAEFLYNRSKNIFMSVETPWSVYEKAKYVREKGLGGMFIWMIDHDNGLLTNAAREGLGAGLNGNPQIDMAPLLRSAAEKENK